MDNQVTLTAIASELKSICNRYNLPYIIADDVVTEGKYYPPEADEVHALLYKYKLKWVVYEDYLRDADFHNGESFRFGRPAFHNDEPICWDKEQ